MKQLKDPFLKRLCNFAVVIMIVGISTDIFSQGLPQEYYVTQRWRDLFSSHSPATNPAFMTEENYLNVRAVLAPTMQNSFLLYELGAMMPIGLYQTVGVSLLGLSTIEPIYPGHLDNTGTVVVIDSSRKYSDNHSTILLSWAYNPFNRFSVGVNGNIYYHSNFGSAIWGLSGDVGISYRLLRHSLLGDHVIGATYQNIASPTLKLKTPMRNTTNLKLSWIGKLWERRIDAGFDIDAKDMISQAKNFTQGKKTVVDFNGRIGGWVLHLFNVYALVADEYLGIAGGVNVPTVNNGRDFQVAFQYLHMNEGIATMQTYYIRADLGKHREEVYARKMARLASIGPSDLYNKARTLYSQEKYYDAMYLFGRILTEYPDFFRNDWVRLFYSICQENLDMREFSTENYQEAKKAFPRSIIIPYADLGLMRLGYRDNQGTIVANQFARLNNPSVPDSLKFHAFYIMGQQYLREGDYRKAVQILQQIPAEHPEYPFAQNSMAVCHVLDNKAVSALEALNNAVQFAPKNKAQQEVIFRSFVLMGYLYYEGMQGVEQSLSKSVSALRKVPSSSYYYEDALLGLAMAALQASQWSDCIAACNAIQTVSKSEVNLCDALLLTAYVSIIEKKYAEAMNILIPAADRIAKAKLRSEGELNDAKMEYDNNRGIYYELSMRANELALTSQSSIVLQQIDSLKAPQNEYYKKLAGYYKFVDEFGRTSFFMRNAEQVKTDIDYALAVCQKMAGKSGEMKIQQKAKQKADEIDDEMNKLQEELNKIENKPPKKP